MLAAGKQRAWAMDSFEREPESRGPAGWDWKEVGAVFLIVSGLVMAGFLSGVRYQQQFSGEESGAAMIQQPTGPTIQ
jgi:hypothetical protein